MLRVILGRVRPNTERSGKIYGLQFNSASGVQDSAQSRDETSTILTVPRSHHMEEVDLEVNGDLGPKTEPLDLTEGMGGMEEEKARIQNA